MTNHYYIYLGRENGKRVIHKVGKTRQTCYARCKNADYKIGCAFELDTDMGERLNKLALDAIENEILYIFKQHYKIEHGREYFRTPKTYWEDIKPFFIEEMKKILDRWHMEYTYYEGWVAPNTY